MGTNVDPLDPMCQGVYIVTQQNNEIKAHGLQRQDLLRQQVQQRGVGLPCPSQLGTAYDWEERRVEFHARMARSAMRSSLHYRRMKEIERVEKELRRG